MSGCASPVPRLFFILIFAILILGTGCHKSHSDDDGGGDSSSEKKTTGGGGAPPPAPAPDPGGGGPPPVPEFTISILVVDEGGAPVGTALVAANGAAPVAVAADGSVSFAGRTEATLFVATAPGFLDEPFVLDSSDAGSPVTVPLRAGTGAGGVPRLVMHLGGDVMLGRRYLAPTQPDTPVVTPGDGGASARAVVSSLSPMTRAAHVTVANLECVVGTLPAADAYPQKRFLIQSPPETMEALDELGVDLVTLGNNHVRDWLEPGLSSTFAAIDGAGVARVGAGLTEADAAVPATVTAAGYDVVFLSYTSITGDAVNDAYPLDADPVPPGLDPDEAWQYEFRSWGFTGPTVAIPVADRRLGSAWAEIVAAEAATSDPVEEADLWTSATAVYPELQDWIARRGHGGANRMSNSRILAEVAAEKAAGADFVVVALHSGHQYADFKSVGTESSAHAAIDAGADLVFCHHPHILEGFEFYKGKLIAWSLGNCVFDQDFLTSFASGVLRVVYEGPVLLEARFLPATLVRYRPVPVGGKLARDIVRAVHERSTIDADADKPDGAVRAVVSPPSPDAAKPRFAFERHAARLTVGPGPDSALDATADSATASDLPAPGLARSRAAGGAPLPAGLLFGRDLFGYGDFEDDAADGVARGGLQWDFDSTNADSRIDVVAGAPSGVRALHLHRVSTNSDRVRLRPVARVTFLQNRLWVDLGGGAAAPLDGPATYTLRLRGRANAAADTRLILDVYHFDDSNPTEDPTSSLLRSVEYAFAVAPDDAWHETLVDIPASAFDPVGSDVANSVMMYLALYPPTTGGVDFWADDVQFVEWREAALLPDFFYATDAVRSSAGPLSFTLERRGE